MATKRELTAPCGLDCFNCIVYSKNITDDVAKMVSDVMRIPAEDAPCRGCRQQNGCRLAFTTCSTLDCAKGKGVEFCFECGDFPCEMLQPAADGAAKYPHNMKLFNLCRIQKVGFEKWAEEESEQIRKKYFEGKFLVGKGPVIE